MDRFFGTNLAMERVALSHYQTESGAQPTSYSMDTSGSFPGGKAAGMWRWPLTSIYCRCQEWVELYLHSPNTTSYHGAPL